MTKKEVGWGFFKLHFGIESFLGGDEEHVVLFKIYILFNSIMIQEVFMLSMSMHYFGEK